MSDCDDGERSYARRSCDGDERFAVRPFCDDGERFYAHPLYWAEHNRVRPFFGGERFYARRLFGEARFSVGASSPGSTRFGFVPSFLLWTVLWSLLFASAWFAVAVLPSLFSGRLW